MLRENFATWHCGAHEISLARPRIMGILNVTPDSFSDGGKNFDAKAAIARGLEMLDEGADIIDVGGESTRPGHTPVSPKVEAERVVPVVRALVEAGAVVSVDTRHAEVARICVRLGAAIINDVSGFTDPEMVDVAADTSCGCIVMHWNHDGLGSRAPRRQATLDQSRPNGSALPRPVLSQRRFTLPEEAPIMRQVMGFLGDQARTLQRAGVSHDRICMDPGAGAGFDKLADEDVVIQRATRSMASMGYPLVCAVSRKRFVGALSGVEDAAARDAATAGACISAIENGARILRVHDVAGVSQAVNAYWAVSHKDPRQGFVSLGSNVGNRVGNIARAVQLIDEIPLTCVVSVSHAYETEPAYGIATPVANAVAEIRTELHPLVLMGKLLEVENKLGRIREKEEAEKGADTEKDAVSGRITKKPGTGPRTIDCDLVWVEGERHAGSRLTLPHPRLGERDYVIVPMEDLMHAPERFLAHAGVEVLPREERVGHVTADLGEVAWE